MDLKKILDKHVEEFFLVITMVIMVLLIFFQSFSRYFLGFSLSWGSELAVYLHIWQIWLGASLGIRLSEHVRIDVFVNLLKGKIKFIVDVFASSIWFLFALFLAYEGSLYVMDLLGNDQTSPTLGIQMGIIYIVIPLSGLLMCIRLIQHIYLLYSKEFKSS